MTLEQELQTQPEFADDLFRSYGPGKFYTWADAYVYELSLDGDGETEQDGDSSYTLVVGPFEHSDLAQYAGAIVFERGDGITSATWFDDTAKLNKTWQTLAEDIASESGEW